LYGHCREKLGSYKLSKFIKYSSVNVVKDMIADWRAIFSMQSLCPDRPWNSGILRRGWVTSLYCWSQECVEIHLHCMVHHRVFLAKLCMHSQLPSVCAKYTALSLFIP